MLDDKIPDIGDGDDPKIEESGKRDEDKTVPNERLNTMDGNDRLEKPDTKKSESVSYVAGRGFRRYDNSVKNLIPIRKRAKDDGTMPIDSAGLFSVVSFSWISNIMYKAYRKGLFIEELPSLSPYDNCDYNADRLELLWKEELAKNGAKKASFARVAWRFCRTRVYFSNLIFIASLLFGFLSPTLLMRKLLEYVQSGNKSYDEGLKWAILLAMAEFFRAIFFAWTWGMNYRTALRLRSACVALLYRKIIRVNNLGNKSIGEVINMFSNDAQRIYDMLLCGPMIIGGPITTIWGIFYVLWLLGPLALIGMTAFLLFYPIQYMLSHLTGYMRTRAVKLSDLRVRLMNEILECIKLIKMYAWEKRFGKELLDVRKKERKLLLKTSYCQGLSVSMAPTIPVISAIITFLAHTAGGNNLTAAQVFPYVSFVSSQLRSTMSSFTYSVETIVAAGCSYDRIKSLLLLEDGNCVISKPILKSQAIAISRGTFACITFGSQNDGKSDENEKKRKKGLNTSAGDESEKQKLNTPPGDPEHVDILFDISFETEKGKLVGICGQVGSGKSSLLLAALGQLRVSGGRVMRDGSCAYVSQQAWITNATLRENILFGAQFDHSRYYKAIYACNLSQDIGMMPGGDQTEIGEKGVNLSGGQKQRVALARALYADRDIYFLDDPLSAVDSKVGSFLFDNLILGALRGKTVIFVTHQIQYLNRCDDIYMMRDGRIIEHGTHDELMKLQDEYALMVAAILADSETENLKIEDQVINDLPKSVDDIPLHDTNPSTTSKPNSQTSTGNVEKSDTIGTPLTVADMVQQGSIKAHAYHSYIVAAGGYLSFAMVLLTFVAAVASTAFSSWWLALWINAGDGSKKTIGENNVTAIHSDNIIHNPDFWYYKTVYASTIGIILSASVLRSLVFTRATIGASTKLHNNLFKKILDSPMRFFDTTPSGRIQHLFSRDMDEVDNWLPITLTSFIQNIFIVFFAVLVICVVFPWFILPLCILAAIYYLVSRIFRVAIRDLKRMENKTRAPIISYATATVQGLSTIHAFGKENDFMSNFTKMFNENSKYLFMCCVAMRWLAVRIDTLSVVITGTTALLVIALQDYVSAPLAGLALSYSAQISGVFQYTIRLVSETEVRFISVERMSHYIKILKGEGGATQPSIEPPSNWPVAAEIKFINVSMAYGEGAPLILRKVSFSVDAGEKIGIVGRTGSGKSSLTIALFRLVELAEGRIEIDGVDISEVGLVQLRTKLSIIPQDPVLFSGTIRSNLDPFKLYTDAEIWQALEKTKLKSRVQLIAGHLDASVGFGGDNLSVGEKQLLCLSRALLRNSKILVLDEATAAVDPETEIAVQNTIQQEFSHCTILIIAHRLQTVLPLNRILVMEDGKVLEFDTPSNLLDNQSSEFSKMIAAAEKAQYANR